VVKEEVGKVETHPEHCKMKKGKSVLHYSTRVKDEERGKRDL